jgi:hypothetical protein
MWRSSSAWITTDSFTNAQPDEHGVAPSGNAHSLNKAPPPSSTQARLAPASIAGSAPQFVHNRYATVTPTRKSNILGHPPAPEPGTAPRLENAAGDAELRRRLARDTLYGM